MNGNEPRGRGLLARARRDPVQLETPPERGDLSLAEQTYLEQGESRALPEPRTEDVVPQIEVEPQPDVRLELERPAQVDLRNRRALKADLIDPEVKDIWDNIRKYTGQAWKVRVKKLMENTKRWSNVGPQLVFNPSIDDPASLEDSIGECYGSGSYMVEFSPPKGVNLARLVYSFEVGHIPRMASNMKEPEDIGSTGPIKDQILNFTGVAGQESEGDGGHLLSIVKRQDGLAQSLSHDMDKKLDELKKELMSKDNLAEKMRVDFDTRFADMKREFASMMSTLKPTNDKPSYLSDLKTLVETINAMNSSKSTPVPFGPQEAIGMLKALRDITPGVETQKPADVNTDILKMLLEQTKSKADPLDYLYKGIKLARGDIGVEDLKEEVEPDKPNVLLQYLAPLLLGFGSKLGGGGLQGLLSLLQGAQAAGGLQGLLGGAQPQAAVPPTHRLPPPQAPSAQPPVRRGRILPFPTPPTPEQPIPPEPRTPVHMARPAPVQQPVAPPDYSVPAVESDPGKIPAQYFQALDAVEGALRSPMSAAEIAMSVRQTIPLVMMAPFLKLSPQRFVEHAAKNLDSRRRVSLMELKDRVIEVFEELKKPAIT